MFVSSEVVPVSGVSVLRTLVFGRVVVASNKGCQIKSYPVAGPRPEYGPWGCEPSGSPLPANSGRTRYTTFEQRCFLFPYSARTTVT